MNENKKRLIEIIFELTNCDELDSSMIDKVDLIDDLNFDSLTFISMIIEIEAKFSIIIPDNLLLIENFRNVGQIVEIIEKNQKKGNNKNGSN